MFGLGWGLMTRVSSGACLHPFLSWGVDAASASRRPGSGSSLGRGTGPSHRRESEARRRQAPAGRRPGEGPWPGGVSSIGAAWVVSGTHGLGSGRPSRAHSPWRGLRNPALSLALPASSAGCRAAVFHGRIWSELPRVSAAEGRAAAASQGSGSSPPSTSHSCPRPRAPSGRTRPAWGQHGLAQRGGLAEPSPHQ